MEFQGICVLMSEDRNWLNIFNKNHLFCPLPAGRFPFVTLGSLMINNPHVLEMKTLFLPIMSLHPLINMFVIKISSLCLLLASSRLLTLIPLLWAMTNRSEVKIIFLQLEKSSATGFSSWLLANILAAARTLLQCISQPDCHLSQLILTGCSRAGTNQAAQEVKSPSAVCILSPHTEQEQINQGKLGGKMGRSWFSCQSMYW